MNDFCFAVLLKAFSNCSFDNGDSYLSCCPFSMKEQQLHSRLPLNFSSPYLSGWADLSNGGKILSAAPSRNLYSQSLLNAHGHRRGFRHQLVNQELGFLTQLLLHHNGSVQWPYNSCCRTKLASDQLNECWRSQIDKAKQSHNICKNHRTTFSETTKHM